MAFPLQGSGTGHIPLDDWLPHDPTHNQQHDQRQHALDLPDSHEDQTSGQTNGHMPLDTTLSGNNHESATIDIDALLAEWTRDGYASIAPNVPSLEKDDIQTGRAAEVQKFYEGRPKCKCCTNWVEKRPQEVPSDAQAKYDGVAVQVYHAQDHTKKTVGSLHTVTAQWVTFQSPVILRVLEPLFKKNGGADVVQGKITLFLPFTDLYFAYNGIMDAHDKCEKGSDEERHLVVLKEVTDELILEATSDVKDLQARGMITWNYLWTLFKKGTIVVAKSEGEECLFEINSFSFSAMKAHCRYVGFDGTNYGFREKTFTEPAFQGTKSIRELLVYPVYFHESRESLERSILGRSNKVLNYQGIHHGEYSNTSSKSTKDQRSETLSSVSHDLYLLSSFRRSS
jgi:hypothetical protein